MIKKYPNVKHEGDEESKIQIIGDEERNFVEKHEAVIEDDTSELPSPHQRIETLLADVKDIFADIMRPDSHKYSRELL